MLTPLRQARRNHTPATRALPGMQTLRMNCCMCLLMEPLCERDGMGYGPYKGGLWIVDVKDPIEPIAVGFLPMFSVFDIKVEGDYAYLGTALPAFQIVDISDPEKPDARRHA